MSWYREELEQGQLWDEQDLTRYILENDLAVPTRPAVFCDEAQDFTRIQLELLLRINLFSARTLSRTDIRRIPFAFAGDRFQTIDPTGFRWDATKTSFVEKFVLGLDPAQQAGATDLNYTELKYNYRSTARIVRFGNLVQALRASLFDMPELRPQIPWADRRASTSVSWYRASDSAFWETDFRNKAGSPSSSLQRRRGA